ncbi:MAG: hypothetical protein M1830_009887 [Pleopsidium flavum]|nr:MAG: hypothetical protein M1830_009923 [Pleopsidium flavum]KAI9874320.1 MAG: hypothetical protein M1830_009887 [Pleopsidium flavum]
MSIINYELPDPALSELGISQCEQLQAHLKHDLPIAQTVGLIVVSPMRRTLQTAKLALGWLIDRGIPVQLRGEWQENSDKPCDTGTKTPALFHEFPEFDFSTVFPDYPSKSGRWAFTHAAITQRGLNCRRWLRARPEAVVVVVSHSGFLRVGVSHSHYANADYRVFSFAEDAGDELVEWELTKERGGGMGNSPKGMAFVKPTEFSHEHQADTDGKEAQAPEEIVNEVPG